MEKEQYLAAPRSSVAEFDALRKRDPTASIDMSGADLTKANLSRAELWGARFKGAKLVDVKVHRAELEGADIRGAILEGVDWESQVCLHPCLFKGARWGKEEMEHFLEVLNQNQDWEIRYELVPMVKAS